MEDQAKYSNDKISLHAQTQGKLKAQSSHEGFSDGAINLIPGGYVQRRIFFCNEVKLNAYSEYKLSNYLVL